MKKKIILVIQGEGRGHLTQATVLKKNLEERGHNIPFVMVGCSSLRKLPEYFYKNINIPVYLFESPNFVTDKGLKKINLFKSLLSNFKKINTFKRSVRDIKGRIDRENPDLIINFYEPLIGIYNLFYKKTKTICIAHQYIYLNKYFKFPKSNILEKIFIILFTKLTSVKSDNVFALSEYYIKSPDKKLVVGPPLIRNEIKNIKTTNQNYFLVYLLNNGLGKEIIQWQQKNPSIKMQCFWDKVDVAEEYFFNDNLIFHKLNDRKFIELMTDCKGLITTAGFESVCEAAYLEKPVMMVPVKGHFEQYCNAQDFKKAGLAYYSKTFNPDFFIDLQPLNSEKIREYKTWCDSYKDLIINLIEKP